MICSVLLRAVLCCADGVKIQIQAPEQACDYDEPLLARMEGVFDGSWMRDWIGW